MSIDAARVLAWARSVDAEWWTPREAAEALGVPEEDVRGALEVLEAEGMIYRAVAKSGFTITADGRGSA